MKCVKHEKGVYEFIGTNRTEPFIFQQQVNGKKLC